MQEFLKFVQTGKAESDLTREIENMIGLQKALEANKSTYFSLSIHDQDKIIEGRKEGINATKIENARNLLAMNVLNHEQIAQAVELPIEKIEELAKEMKDACS